jgi:hypothetical protein
MEKLSGPDVMKAMMSRCASIEEALDATAKILEERHVKETVDMIEKGKLKLSDLKAHVESLTPVNPGEFVWKVLSSLRCYSRLDHSCRSWAWRFRRCFRAEC